MSNVCATLCVFASVYINELEVTSEMAYVTMTHTYSLKFCGSFLQFVTHDNMHTQFGTIITTSELWDIVSHFREYYGRNTYLRNST